MDSRVLGHAVWELFGVLFEVLVTARAHFCEIDGRVLGGLQVDGRVLGGMQSELWCRCCFGILFGMLFGVLFGVLVMVRAHFCEIDGRVLWECCLGVLFGVLVRAHFVIDGRVLGGMQFGVRAWVVCGAW